MTLPSIIQRSFEIIIIQTYNFVQHNIYLPSYNSWHICLCLTLVFISLLCIADQFLWKGNLFLKAGRRKKETMRSVFWVSLGGMRCLRSLTYLPNASETMSNLSSTFSFHAFRIWVVVWNKPEQSEHSKSIQWSQYTKLFVSLRASGMMHFHFVYPDIFFRRNSYMNDLGFPDIVIKKNALLK